MSCTAIYMVVFHGRECVYPLSQCLCVGLLVCLYVNMCGCGWGDHETVTVTEMRVSWPLLYHPYSCTKTHCLTCAPYNPALPGSPSDSSTCTSGVIRGGDVQPWGKPELWAFTQLGTLASESGPPE